MILGGIMKSKLIVLFLITGLFIACGGSQVSQSIGFIPRQMVIALAPSGGVLADAIGIELFNRGFTVVDTQQFSNFMVRHNMTELEFSQPQNLKIIKEEGINAILMVKSVAGYDQKPQSATARLNSTDDWGKIIAGVSWKNGWGGRAGSIADRSMRKDIPGAAKQIVQELLKQ